MKKVISSGDSCSSSGEGSLVEFGGTVGVSSDDAGDSAVSFSSEKPETSWKLEGP